MLGTDYERFVRYTDDHTILKEEDVIRFVLSADADVATLPKAYTCGPETGFQVKYIVNDTTSSFTLTVAVQSGDSAVGNLSFPPGRGCFAISDGQAQWTIIGGAGVGGAGSVIEADLSFSDITTANATSALHGLMPKLTPGTATASQPVTLGADKNLDTLALDALTGHDSSFGITGLADTQGGAVVITGGASSTSGNAGGASSVAGGVGGATGVGGAASLASGAGGSTSGASGAVTVASGTTTAESASASGTVTVQSGAGSNSTGATNGGASGTVTVRSQAGGTAATGTGGAGGAVSTTSGAGGAASGNGTGGVGGAVASTAGAGGAAAGTGAAVGGVGGANSVTAGNGGAAAGTSAAGAGGAASLVSGTGGAKTGTGTANGGAGGTLSITGGNGGATASTNAASVGGAGAAINITAGTGGAISAGTGNGGVGGNASLTGGAGGLTTGGVGGAGGNVVLTPGAGGGAGGGSAGVNGVIRNVGVIIRQQTTPSTPTTAATLTAANLMKGILTATPTATGATVAYTLPVGTDMDLAGSFSDNDSYDWSITNLAAAAADTITITANTAHTIVGNPIVQSAHASTGGITGNSAVYRSRRVSSGVWVTYRYA